MAELTEPNPPTEAEYSAYLELAEKATAGPWEVVKSGSDLGVSSRLGTFRVCKTQRNISGISDMQFIAASRRIGPAAVRRMQRLETSMRKLMAELRTIDNQCIDLWCDEAEEAMCGD